MYAILSDNFLPLHKWYWQGFFLHQKWLTVVFQRHSSIALHFLNAFCRSQLNVADLFCVYPIMGIYCLYLYFHCTVCSRFPSAGRSASWYETLQFCRHLPPLNEPNIQYNPPQEGVFFSDRTEGVRYISFELWSASVFPSAEELTSIDVLLHKLNKNSRYWGL